MADYENQSAKYGRAWDARRLAVGVPTDGIFDEPTVCIKINAQWIGHFDGILERLMWRDAWDGTPEQIDFAVEQMGQFLATMQILAGCGDAVDVRQSVTDCKIFEKLVDGEWIEFANLNGCAIDGVDGTNGTDGEDGVDGASPEMRVYNNFIQWRQDDDSPPWTNLIALSALQGPPGPPGGNVYPPLPTSNQSTELCNAAAYMVIQIRNLIAEVYAELATIEPGEVFQAVLNQGGWSAAALYDLITFGSASLEDEIEILAAFDAASDDLKCQLVKFSLDKFPILNWVSVIFASSVALRDAMTHAINAAATDGRWSLWATVGATLTTDNCNDCIDDAECVDYTFTINPLTTAGKVTGVQVFEGQTVEITATGIFYPYGPGGGVSYGPDGQAGTTSGSGFLLPGARNFALVAKVAGGAWHQVGADGSFTAEAGGFIYVNINGQTGGNNYTLYAGTQELSICAIQATIQLIPYYPNYLVEYEGKEGAMDVYVLTSISTGNYATGGAQSVGNVPFLILEAEAVVGEWAPGTIILDGSTSWGVDTVPDDLPAVAIGIGLEPPGSKLRIKVVAA